MAFKASIEQMTAQLRDLQSPVSDIQVMAKIIMSFPPSFRIFISSWDSVPTFDKTIAHLTSRLNKKEKLTSIFNKGAIDPSDSVFFTGGYNNPRQAKVIYNNNRLGDYSGQNNYNGTREGRRGNYHSDRRSSRGQRGGYTSGHGVCYYCEFPGHVIKNCRIRVRDERNGNQPDDGKPYFGLQASFSFCARRSCDWYSDSGATQHMTDLL